MCVSMRCAWVRATRCFSWKYGCQTSFTYLSSKIHMCFNAFDPSPGLGSTETVWLERGWHVVGYLRRARTAQHRQLSGISSSNFYPFIRGTYSIPILPSTISWRCHEIRTKSQLTDSSTRCRQCTVFGRKRWYRMLMKLQPRSRILHTCDCVQRCGCVPRSTRKGRHIFLFASFYDADRVAASLLLLLSRPKL